MAARAWRRSAAAPRAWAATAAAAVVAAAAAAGAPRARAFSTFAGSCEHAGVVHGLDPVHEAQGGSGGHAVTLAGEIVAGEKVGVTLSGEKPYKGLNLYAVDASSGDVIGEFEVRWRQPARAALPVRARTCVLSVASSTVPARVRVHTRP